MNEILVVSGAYQLGDNPGLFQDSIYCGDLLSLPMTLVWLDQNASNVAFIVYTHDVETWGNWSGHRVSINNVEIGRLKDPNDVQGRSERFELVVPRSKLESALGGANTFVVRIELERQPQVQGMADDFVVTRLATDGVAIRLGGR
jgi:hypothetical protein